MRPVKDTRIPITLFVVTRLVSENGEEVVHARLERILELVRHLVLKWIRLALVPHMIMFACDLHPFIGEHLKPLFRLGSFLQKFLRVDFGGVVGGGVIEKRSVANHRLLLLVRFVSYFRSFQIVDFL